MACTSQYDFYDLGCLGCFVTSFRNLWAQLKLLSFMFKRCLTSA